jgi:hypothetical protein
VRMKRFYPLAMLLIIVLPLAGTALAQGEPEALPRYAGHYTVDLPSGQVMFKPAPATLQAAGDVYNNLDSPLVWALSSTDLAATWGDRLITAGAGMLEESAFTIYNSSASAGPLLTLGVAINFYDGPTTTWIGGYNGTINFGAGLGPSYYAIITFTGLSVLGIDLTSTDIVMTQTRTTHTGGATRLGIVGMYPPTVGTSPDVLYINASTIGPAGWYSRGAGASDPGYRVNVTGTTPATPSTWGRVKSLYR